MEAFWSFLRHKRNRDLLGWIGGGLIVIATGFWAIFTYVFPPSAKSPAGAQANCGAVAIGGNVSQSTVTAGNPVADCSPKSR